MNFLSHYYFDRASNNNFQIIGSVLPDLVRNAVPNANLFPDKIKSSLSLNEKCILFGWNKHLLVDKHFHSSHFFSEQTAKLKPLLIPIVHETQIRPSFLAHIALELLLDHLLLEEQIISAKKFYETLKNVDRAELESFLFKAKLQQIELFFSSFDKFIASEYLFSYKKLESISYALNQICLRLWPEGLDQTQRSTLTEALAVFKKNINNTFLQIFNEITEKLEDPN